MHHRRSVRLKGYDYTQPGAYFVTIVTWQRQDLFGEVVNGAMRLNAAGEIAQGEWSRLARRYGGIDVSDFVVMPNHVHGIIVISESDRKGTAMNEIMAHIGSSRRAPTDTVERFSKPVAGSIPTIIRSYKSSVTCHINTMDRIRGAAVWQRNYYEHIIRDQTDWEQITAYIQSNPAHWETDSLYPLPAPKRFNQDGR